ncbi:hypothetical protein ACTFIY_002596 [Dictyostelium cf. discoideum]
MNDDPYGHLFIHCTITRHYINIPTLSQNIYKITNNPNNPSFTILNNTINPIFNSKFKPVHHIHGYYLSDRNTTGKFEWSYRDLNFHLNRTEAYRNYISIILHYPSKTINPSLQKPKLVKLDQKIQTEMDRPHIDTTFPLMNY